MNNMPVAIMQRSLTATELIANMVRLTGWTLSGDGADVAIEKTFNFANYYQTIAFVNAVAFIVHAQDHHPDLSVHFDCCVVRLHTHAVNGVSLADFESAARVDALLA